MILVHLDRISHSYGARLVFQNLSWEIQQGHKVGLVGPNGAGKSTLLRIIAGELVPDQGRVIRSREVKLGYLAQEPQFDPTHTVWEETLSAADVLLRTETELRRLEARMASPEVWGDPTLLERTLAAHARVQSEFERLDGYRLESRAREVLKTLGFADADFDLPMRALSGGQKKLVGLARLLLNDLDLLLLDEPDNHLDLDSKAYLEQFIKGFSGAVIIVSHDRYLLDGVAQTIVEIEDGRLTMYEGNYSYFAVEKQLRLLRQQQMYEAQQKQIAHLEASIARFEYWASVVVNERHARQARSRRKMLERMERVERPVLERRQMDLELNGWRGSNKVLEIVNLDMSFGDQVLFAGLNLLIWHGERVGLLGANGTGKSVLLRCILGQLTPTAGTIKIGPSVQIGYYAQEHETLDPNRTLIEEIRALKPMYEQEAVRFLGRFLFPYSMTRNRVGDLSGGERSRLQLARLMLSGANFLLLDEPTNNLDLPSCEVLEAALDDFEGSVLVVSHDRYFLDRVVDRVVELEDGVLTGYEGDYTFYRQEKAKRQDLT